MNENINNIISQIKINPLVEVFENIQLNDKINARWIVIERCNVRCMFVPVNESQNFEEIREIANQFQNKVLLYTNDGHIYRFSEHYELITENINSIKLRFDNIDFSTSLFINYKNTLKLFYNFFQKFIDTSTSNIYNLNNYLILKRLLIPQEHPFGFEMNWQRNVKYGEFKTPFWPSKVSAEMDISDKIIKLGHTFPNQNEFRFKFNFLVYKPYSIQEESMILSKFDKLYEAGKPKFPQILIDISAYGFWSQVSTYKNIQNKNQEGEESLYFLSYNLGDKNIMQERLMDLQNLLDSISSDSSFPKEFYLHDQDKIFRY